jgi:hypothetical protein
MSWAAGFVCFIYDNIRGRRAALFFSPGHYQLPKLPQRSWQWHIRRFPVYCVGVPLLLGAYAIFIPPAFIVGKLFKLRARIGKKVPNQSKDPTP